MVKLTNWYGSCRRVGKIVTGRNRRWWLLRTLVILNRYFLTSSLILRNITVTWNIRNICGTLGQEISKGTILKHRYRHRHRYKYKKTMWRMKRVNWTGYWNRRTNKHNIMGRLVKAMKVVRLWVIKGTKRREIRKDQ